MDAVQRAKSGHPGTPMALAPVAYTLWQSFLRFNPDDPLWPNRDRFVLSNGHASMLLYALLHLCGVKAVRAKYEPLDELAVTLENIKRFNRITIEGHMDLAFSDDVDPLVRFGFTPAKVLAAAKEQIAKSKGMTR
jgi:transketolase